MLKRGQIGKEDRRKRPRQAAVAVTPSTVNRATSVMIRMARGWALPNGQGEVTVRKTRTASAVGAAGDSRCGRIGEEGSMIQGPDAVYAQGALAPLADPRARLIMEPTDKLRGQTHRRP